MVYGQKYGEFSVEYIKNPYAKIKNSWVTFYLTKADPEVSQFQVIAHFKKMKKKKEN